MDTLEQSELTVSVHFFARFLNQEYQFTIPNSRIRLSKKTRKRKKNTDNCKPLCVSRKYNKETNGVKRLNYFVK